MSFILRDDIPNHVTSDITTEVVDMQQHDTQSFWFNWVSKSSYKGRWREKVHRSLMILKLLTYEPTGAIIAAPTFSIPEDIGGARSAASTTCLMIALTLSIEIGITASAGFVIRVSQSIFSFAWALWTRQMPTCRLSAIVSDYPGVLMARCLSCSRSEERLKFLRSSWSKPVQDPSCASLLTYLKPSGWIQR